jgi:hypothetical protein
MTVDRGGGNAQASIPLSAIRPDSGLAIFGSGVRVTKMAIGSRERLKYGEFRGMSTKSSGGVAVA